jgi:ketosteroid isomerase-like protein
MKALATQSQLHSFFDLMAASLRALDTKAMANLYMMPCTLVSDETTLAFTDPARLEGFFNRGAMVYKQMGVAQVQADVWNRQVWSPNLLLVKVKWKYANQKGAELYNCDYNYVVHTDKDGHLRIVMSASINEKERMEAWQRNLKKS